MSGLNGKRAIVTGGGRGIGLAIAQKFAALGERVVCLDIDPSGAAGQAGLVPPARDIADRDAVLAAVNGFAADAGGVEILVRNAVFFSCSPLADMDPGVIDKLLDIAIKGTCRALQAAKPHMIRAGGGSVITLSSIAVGRSKRDAAVYTAIKGALDAPTRQQPIELAPHDMRVNAVAPGSIPTSGANPVIGKVGWTGHRAGQDHSLRDLAWPKGARPMKSKEHCERGLEIRRRVLGAEFVDKAIAAADDFNLPMQDLTTVRVKM